MKERDDIVTQARYIFSIGRMIPEQLLKAQGRHLAANGGFSGGDLSMAQLHALHVVRRNGPLAMGELAERLGITAPSASAMVDRLVERGILCREHSTQDRRKVVVSISPSAVEEIRQAEEGALSFFIELIKKLGPDTVQKWCEVLAAIQQVLNDGGGDPKGGQQRPEDEQPLE